METKRRICQQCETYRPLDDFRKAIRGYMRICRECEDAIQKDPRLERTSFCIECKQIKGLSGFHRSSRGRVWPRCRTCVNRAPHLIRNRMERYLKSRYGITLEVYDSMLDACDRKCPICGDPHIEVPTEFARKRGKLAVDHDHVTGRIRGLLCIRCNQALGLFQESEEIMLRAVDYLRRTTPRSSNPHP